MKDKSMFFVTELIENGEDFVAATIIETGGSTPRKSGAWMVMASDGRKAGTVGGGKLEAETEKRCMEMHATKEARSTYHFVLNTTDQGALDMGCGGDADVLIEYIPYTQGEAFLRQFRSDETAYIFGAGHVALALEPVLRHVGFDTVVLDDREEYANRERFPQAKEVKVIRSYDLAFEDIEPDEQSYFIIVTRGHMGDYDVLKQAITKPHKYLGMIGSKTKTALLYDMLRKEGVDEKVINGIYAPIGERIHAETPEEISISIAGELIRVRSGHGKEQG
jgi:xanthine dehydrogenase accessory factor